jgi:hypothetical protein
VALDPHEPLPTANDETAGDAMVRLREIVTVKRTAPAPQLPDGSLLSALPPGHRTPQQISTLAAAILAHRTAPMRSRRHTDRPLRRRRRTHLNLGGCRWRAR